MRLSEQPKERSGLFRPIIVNLLDKNDNKTCAILSISHLNVVGDLLCQHIDSALRMSWS
jgi:hypothetical protein